MVIEQGVKLWSVVRESDYYVQSLIPRTATIANTSDSATTCNSNIQEVGAGGSQV